MYKYNMNLLENMTIEHKKNINDQELKRKDRLIEGLIKQIDLRDKCIKDAYQQIEKNSIEFNYQNPDLIKRNDIDLIFLQNKFNKIETARDSIKNSYKNKILNFNINNKDNNKKDDDKKVNIKDEKNLFLKKIKIKNTKNKNEIDEKNYNSLLSERNSHYKNELFAILLKSKNGSKINDFINKRKIQHNKNPINSHSLKHISIKKINTNEVKNGRAFSGINEMNESKNKSMIVKFETEFQKKVKTIIKKNYISRYNKSPFLKNF